MVAQVLAAFYLVLAAVLAQPEQPDYFVEALVDNPTPYVGEQIIYTFRVYTAVSLPRTDFVPPDFEGFWRTEVGPASSYVEFVEGKLYTVTELDTALYPSYAGELVIEPAVLTLPATVFRDAEVLRSDPVMVLAQVLPDDAPLAFDGAVGQFEMEVTLDRQVASVGEPFTLRLRVTGTGNIEQIAPPEVNVPDGWRLYDNATRYAATRAETDLIGEKVFEWLLLPTSAGDFRLPPISLSYFDPAGGVYRSIDTVVVDLQVLGGEAAADAVDVTAITDDVPDARTLPAVLGAAGVNVSPGVLVLWLLPPLLVVGAWWWQRYTQNAESRRQRQWQAGALERARVTLQAAKRATNQATSRLVIQAVQGYFSDKMLRETGTLNMAELDAVMAQHGVSVKLRQHVAQCLDSAYSNRFAPVDDTDVNGLIEHTARVLAGVDREWRA